MGFKGKAPFKGSFSGTKTNKDKYEKGGDRRTFNQKKAGAAAEKPKVKVYTREERKQLRKERKLAKPNAAEATEVNKIFGSNVNELSKAERVEAAQRTVHAAGSKILDLCRRHDTARALQLVFKYGNKDVRQLAWSQIKGHVVSLTKNKTGHFVILSMAKHYTTIHAEMIAELKGSIRSLATNKDGAQLLDFLYTSSPPQQQYLILRELLDPAFGVFTNETTKQIDQHLHHSRKHEEEKKKRHLDEIMQQVPNIYEIEQLSDEDISKQPHNLLAWLVARDPANRCVVYDKIELFLQRASDKDCLMFRFFHPILLQYLQVVPITISSKRHLMQQIARTPLNLWHSKEGSLCAFIILNYLTLKDRKAFTKSIKGRILELALHETGYLLILGLLHTVDDTVWIKKQIFVELFAKKPVQSDTTGVGQPPALVQLMTTLPGMKILSYIFNPSLNHTNYNFFSPKWYTQAELELFKPVYVPQYLIEQDAKAEKEKEAEEKADAAFEADLAKKAAENGIAATEEPTASITDDKKMTDKEYDAMMKQSEITRLEKKNEEVKFSTAGLDTTPTRTFKKDYVDKSYDLALFVAPIILSFFEETTPAQLFGFEEHGNLQRSNVGMMKDDDSDSSDSDSSDSDSDSDDDDEEKKDNKDDESSDDEKDDPKSLAEAQKKLSIVAQQQSFEFRDQLKAMPQKETLFEALSKHRIAIDVLFQFFSALSLRSMSLPADQTEIAKTTIPTLISTHTKHFAGYQKFYESVNTHLKTLASLVNVVHPYTTIQSFDPTLSKSDFKQKSKENQTSMNDQQLFTTSSGLELHQPDHILANGKSHLLFKRLVSDVAYEPDEETRSPFAIIGLAPQQRQLFSKAVYDGMVSLKNTHKQFWAKLKVENRCAWVVSALFYNNQNLARDVFKADFPTTVPKGQNVTSGMEILIRVLKGEKIQQGKQDDDKKTPPGKGDDKKKSAKAVAEEKKEAVKPSTPSKRKAAPKEIEEQVDEEVSQPAKRTRAATKRK